MQPMTPVTPGINPGEPLPGGTIPTDVPMPPDPVGPPDYDPHSPQPIPGVVPGVREPDRPGYSPDHLPGDPSNPRPSF